MSQVSALALPRYGCLSFEVMLIKLSATLFNRDARVYATGASPPVRVTRNAIRPKGLLYLVLLLPNPVPSLSFLYQTHPGCVQTRRNNNCLKRNASPKMSKIKKEISHVDGWSITCYRAQFSFLLAIQSTPFRARPLIFRHSSARSARSQIDLRDRIRARSESMAASTNLHNDTISGPFVRILGK